jgi:hypothetical protein
MHDYAVNRCSRKCAVEQRPLESGERYVSMIVDRNREITRQDISETAWTEPPENCIAWWRSQMPTREAAHRVPAPNHVLLDTLIELCESPEDTQLAFVLGLLLLRRRVLQEASKSIENDEFWVLSHPIDGTEYFIPNVQCDPTELASHEERLMELLYIEQ